MKRTFATSLTCLLAIVLSVAQPQRTRVYGEHNGLSHRHVTQILQDKVGFMWFSTWNGLNRFDGREFVVFKSRPGDGVDMPSDRIRKIAIDNHDDNIINCRVDESWFRFSLLSGTFSPVSARESRGLTSLTIESRPTAYMVNGLKEIRLNANERTVDISFAVLDYRNADNIRYAYRVRGDADWHYLGNDNHVRLAELSPGHYLLDLKATNAMGTWNPESGTLSITVEPKFTETVWFRLILVLLSAAILLAAGLTTRFIRRMKAKQKETLEAYLSLLEESRKEPELAATPSQALSEEDEAIMNRIMAFVEEHIADAEIGVYDLASAAAMSRSSLNRKMKSLVGLTPADFLREARIKRARQLLAGPGASVADVAYRCGFTDPKYFSRVFKQSTGLSPSEYKAKYGH